jgi:hypothetical protein
MRERGAGIRARKLHATSDPAPLVNEREAYVNADADAVADDRRYTYLLGGLHASIGALELYLRMALYLMTTPRAERLSTDTFTQSPKCWFTRYADLSASIAEYNQP